MALAVLATEGTQGHVGVYEIMMIILDLCEGKVLYYCKILRFSIGLLSSHRRLDRIRIALGSQSSIDHSSSASFCLKASVTSTRKYHPKPVVPTTQKCCVPSGNTLSSVATVHDIITASYPSSLPLLSV